MDKTFIAPAVAYFALGVIDLVVAISPYDPTRLKLAIAEMVVALLILWVARLKASH